MLAWILEDAGLESRLPDRRRAAELRHLGAAARDSRRFFVIEADEYDTAFFDKRSKFVHYRPRTAILNNLEFDHADIFPDLAAIETQFHHLVRTVPARGPHRRQRRARRRSSACSRAAAGASVERFGVEARLGALREQPSGEPSTTSLSRDGEQHGHASTGSCWASTTG